MWADREEIQKAEKQAAAALRPPRRKKPEGNRVLRCQAALCLAGVLAAFLLQKAAPQRAERVKAEARTLLSSPLQGQEEIVRFAMAAAEKLEEAVQAAGRASETPASQTLAAFGTGGKAPQGSSLQSLVPKKKLGQPLPQLQVSSGYGWRKTPQKDFHTGVDLAAAQGTKVYPVLSGYVRAAGCHPSYGNYLRILHENGVETLYAHMEYLFVSQGSFVQQTTCLGTVGQTGNATGPHLHFELLQDDVRYDPGKALGL